MKANGMGIVACVAAGLVAVTGFAQGPEPTPGPAPEGQPETERGEMRAPRRPAVMQAEATGKAVAAVATNAAVAVELGLSEAQVAAIAAGLDAEKVRMALDAQQLAETVCAVLTDPRIAADLNITEGQKLVIRQKMTPELLLKALSAEDLARLGRAATPMGAISGAMDAMRQRAMQFENMSPEERAAAVEGMRRRMEEMQRTEGGRRGERGDRGSPRGQQRSPQRGGERGEPAKEGEAPLQWK